MFAETNAGLIIEPTSGKHKIDKIDKIGTGIKYINKTFNGVSHIH